LELPDASGFKTFCCHQLPLLHSDTSTQVVFSSCFYFYFYSSLYYYCLFRLYDGCQWDDKAIRKLIGDGKLAARLTGSEYRTSEADRECPICFLHYSEINVSKCCQATMCTECYLQVRPQKEKSSCCPFCNHNKLQISVAKQMLESQIQEREQEEQRVIEARIREQQNGNKGGRDDLDPTIRTANHHHPNENHLKAANSNSSTEQYGSSLQEDDMVKIMRARSESFASSENNKIMRARSESFASSCENNNDQQQHDDETAVLQSLAMTPDERRRLEDQMRAQHSHPVALRIQAEAAERRLQNEQAYYRTHIGSLQAASDPRVQRTAELLRSAATTSGGGSSRRIRGTTTRGGMSNSSSGSTRDWNQIVEAFERGGNGEVQSIDDLVVLEAAILLSMEEEARNQNNSRTATDSGGEDDDEDENENDDFDVARHARDGFPLVRSFLAARGEDGVDNATNEQVQMMARSFSTSRRSRRQHQLLRGGGGGDHRGGSTGDSTLDTASLLMRGISEEDQMALAIAASLQDHASSSNGEEGSSEQEHTSSAASASAAAFNDELELEGGGRAVVGIMLEDIIPQHEMDGIHNHVFAVASDGAQDETGEESSASSSVVPPRASPVQDEETTSVVVETHQGSEEASNTISIDSDEELESTDSASAGEGAAAAVLPEEVEGLA
jgi:hypothetical protein